MRFGVWALTPFLAASFLFSQAASAKTLEFKNASCFERERSMVDQKVKRYVPESYYANVKIKTIAPNLFSVEVMPKDIKNVLRQLRGTPLVRKLPSVGAEVTATMHDQTDLIVASSLGVTLSMRDGNTVENAEYFFRSHGKNMAIRLQHTQIFRTPGKASRFKGNDLIIECDLPHAVNMAAIQKGE